jgi:biopolymer transport protein ExbD
MAMSTSTQGAHSSVSDINVTPMIDVLLVLLIIFMITQPLNRMSLRIQVPPPSQPTTAPPTNSNQIVLELPDNGSYLINGQPLPKDQLDAQLHAIYDARPAKLLFVKPGRNRIFQEVVDAMDVARGAGIQIIGFTPKEADAATPAAGG